ncbi:MAG: PEP/pyruvate-binding domain-containing protein [Myxococcota bacterium]
MSGLVPLAAARDAARFGGKAAGLSRALAADLPVPPGLALTPEAAAAFAAAGDDSAHASHAARAALAHATAELPFPWAVRSSALDEDGARASFAGIHLSVLGVTSLDEAVAAVASVLASADSDGARAYRRRLGLPASGAERMAVVIQALVPRTADVAGVLFTRNPASGASRRVIEATWGLGEAVVAGLVADIVRVARSGALIGAHRREGRHARGRADGRRVEREVEPRPRAGARGADAGRARAGEPLRGLPAGRGRGQAGRSAATSSGGLRGRPTSSLAVRRITR